MSESDCVYIDLRLAGLLVSFVLLAISSWDEYAVVILSTELVLREKNESE